MPDLYWQQAEPEDIDAWEFQKSVDSKSWDYVEGVSDASQCSTCFTAFVHESDEGFYYRARSVSLDGSVSDWSPPMRVPEHDFMVGVTFCVIFLFSLVRMRCSNG